MKINCEKAELLRGINIVMKAVSSKSLLPISKCILLTVTEKGISLTGNDNELGIETIIKGQIQENGSIAIDAKLFYDIIKAFPAETVNLETDENLITKISCDKAKFELPCLSGEQFTLLPEFEKTNKITVSELLLKNAISKTIFSVALNEKNNIIMTGELFKVEENRLTLISLDGHRISKRIIECETNGSFLDNIIIPGKSLTELLKIMDDDSKANVDIFCSNHYVSFEFNDTKILTRLIDGEYFNFEAMLNVNSEIKININRKDLMSSIERALLMIRESDKKPVVLQIFDDSIILSINTTIGSMSEEIEIIKQGNDLTVGINPKFLIDILKSVDEETIDIYFNGSKAPCIIKDEKESYIYLFMPINMN